MYDLHETKNVNGFTYYMTTLKFLWEKRQAQSSLVRSLSASPFLVVNLCIFSNSFGPWSQLRRLARRIIKYINLEKIRQTILFRGQFYNFEVYSEGKSFGKGTHLSVGIKGSKNYECSGLMA